MYTDRQRESNRIHSTATTGAGPRPASSTSTNSLSAEGNKTDKRSRSPPEEDSRNTRARHATGEEEKTHVKDEHLPYMRELRKKLKKAERQINYLTECIETYTTPSKNKKR